MSADRHFEYLKDANGNLDSVREVNFDTLTPEEQEEFLTHCKTITV